MHLPAPASSIAGEFASCPIGFVLHSSRSGIDRDEMAEFRSTADYAESGAGGLSWHATIGPGILATHLSPRQWGWNCRAPESSRRIAVEFSQGLLGAPISEWQIATFCWYVREVVLPVWPDIPMDMVCHGSLPAGKRDGKSDPYPDGPEADAFVTIVMAGLSDWGG